MGSSGPAGPMVSHGAPLPTAMLWGLQPSSHSPRAEHCSCLAGTARPARFCWVPRSQRLSGEASQAPCSVLWDFPAAGLTKSLHCSLHREKWVLLACLAPMVPRYIRMGKSHSNGVSGGSWGFWELFTPLLFFRGRRACRDSVAPPASGVCR